MPTLWARPTQPVHPATLPEKHSTAAIDPAFKEGREVPRCLPLLSGTGTLAKGHALWITVKYHPKGEDVDRYLFSHEATYDHHKWHAERIDIGGADQALNSYTLAVVDVDQATWHAKGQLRPTLSSSRGLLSLANATVALHSHRASANLKSQVNVPV
ncbi:hypothetical protein ACN2WE_00345 [Streptomyces sp. cg28]|uniref:hypothetical protein n=1 Tax=Streptomyces sp. cg28 TaxID=3403457 RepID=UPI003B228E8B